MRLFKYCVILCFSCVCAISLALALGRHAPLPEEVAALHLDECELPCWIGITPGVTTIAEAKKQIERVYGNNPDYLIQSQYEDPIIRIKHLGETIMIDFYAPSSDADLPISDLYLTPSLAYPGPSSTLTIGHVLNLVGMPIDVGTPPYAYLGALALFPKDHRISVYMNQSDFICKNNSPTSPINVIVMSADEPDEKTLESFNVETWQGFKSCYDFSDSQ